MGHATGRVKYLYRLVMPGRKPNDIIVAGAITNELGNITESAPILSRFKGQHIDRLHEWARKNKGEVKQVSQWTEGTS